MTHLEMFQSGPEQLFSPPSSSTRIAEWRSELSIRPCREAANLESRDKAIGKSMVTISRRDSESRNEIQTYLKLCPMVTFVGRQVLISPLIVMWLLADSQLTIIPFIGRWECDPWFRCRQILT
jgi:hypothetical protein